MSRSGLTFPPAAVRGDDLPALAEVDGGPRSSPRRRVVCLVSACAGILVTAGVAGGVIGLRGADRPAGHGYAHQASAVRSHKPGVLPGAGMLPASGTPAGVVPYAPTAAAPRPSPDSPARSTLRSVPPPAHPVRTPTPGVGTAAPSPTSTPGPSGSGSPSPGTSGGGSPSPEPSGSGSPSAPDGT